jgi:hypothetical protein
MASHSLARVLPLGDAARLLETELAQRSSPTDVTTYCGCGTVINECSRGITRLAALRDRRAREVVVSLLLSMQRRSQTSNRRRFPYRVKGAGRAASRGRVLCRDDAMAWIRRREPRGSRPVHLRRVAPNRRIPGRRYEALARPRRWREALLRSSSSAARSAIRSSSLISRHTVDRRDPDRRTCPAASSSPSSFRVGS